MAGNIFGRHFRISTFGESHGRGLGVVIDGCPAGIALCEADIQTALDRRKPGQEKASWASPRKESDACEILSGVFEGKTLGTPITIVVKNRDVRSRDYAPFKTLFRPGHADEAWQKKYGHRDWRGGGRSSGRETLARVAAGAVAEKITEQYGISIDAVAYEIAGIACNPPLAVGDAFPAEIEAKLNELKNDGDSAGAKIRCTVHNPPLGLGEPVFDKLDAVLAHAMLSIGAVNGIEFGSGFRASALSGSEVNRLDAGHNGGISGGISTGADIVFCLSIKPVPSIEKTQLARTADGSTTELKLTGRHDRCLFPRIIPVIEAMTRLVLADMLLATKSNKI